MHKADPSITAHFPAHLPAAGPDGGGTVMKAPALAAQSRVSTAPKRYTSIVAASPPPRDPSARYAAVYSPEVYDPLPSPFTPSALLLLLSPTCLSPSSLLPPPALPSFIFLAPAFSTAFSCGLHSPHLSVLLPLSFLSLLPVGANSDNLGQRGPDTHTHTY